MDENKELKEQLIKILNDSPYLGELTINYSMSGYCVYPEFHFNIDEINKHLYKKEEPTKTAIEQYADKHKSDKSSNTEQER